MTDTTNTRTIEKCPTCDQPYDPRDRDEWWYHEPGRCPMEYPPNYGINLFGDLRERVPGSRL